MLVVSAADHSDRMLILRQIRYLPNYLPAPHRWVAFPIRRCIRYESVQRHPQCNDRLMSVQLAFQDEKLRQRCESPISARRCFGPEVARTLLARLADLRAADSAAEFLSLELAEVDCRHPNRIRVRLENGYVLFAQVSSRPEPHLPSGELNWKQVTRLKILSIERANEK